MQIIGITGRKQNGKDTIGNYLIENYGYERYAFADPLKEICKILFGFNDDQLWGNKKEEMDFFWKTTPRKLFQFIGTELFREQLDQVLPDITDDIWVKVLEKKLIDSDPLKKIVITDIRFQNECDLIKKLGGTLIRVTRNTLEVNDLHSSEKDIDYFNVDYEIINNTNKMDLYEKIDVILRQ
jgi:hypothetical protein